MENKQTFFAPLYLTELITLFQVHYLHRPRILGYTLNHLSSSSLPKRSSSSADKDFSCLLAYRHEKEKMVRETQNRVLRSAMVTAHTINDTAMTVDNIFAFILIDD